MVLFVEKGNELFFEVLLCELRHEVIGKFGEMVTRGIFPTTVEQILDIEGHIKIVREKLENPKNSDCNCICDWLSTFASVILCLVK